MARRKLTVKAQGPDARATFTLEPYKGKVRITTYDCPHVCVAILDTAQADNLVELFVVYTLGRWGARSILLDACPVRLGDKSRLLPGGRWQVAWVELTPAPQRRNSRQPPPGQFTRDPETLRRVRDGLESL